MTITSLASGPELGWRDVLNRLSSLETHGAPVLTLYLRLEAEDRLRHRFRLVAKEAIRRLQGSPEYLERPGEERVALDRDLARVTAHLDVVSGLPHAPGLVLVVSGALDLFEALPLPHVLQTRLHLGPRPRLAEARAVLEAFQRIVVAVVDRTHARFFEVTGLDAVELPCLALPATRGGKFHSDRADAPGRGERDFHNRIREERHRRAVAVSRELARLAAGGPCHGVVLAGPLRTTSELTRFLPRTLAGQLLGIVPLNPTSVTVAKVREAALTLRREQLRSQESRLLAEINDGLATGWGVKGLLATLRALNRGQVRLLLVPAGQAVSGFRCPGSGRLVLAARDCSSEGAARPVADLMGEVLEEALEQGVEVVLLEDPRIATQVDGAAALLRFR